MLAMNETEWKEKVKVLENEKWELKNKYDELLKKHTELQKCYDEQIERNEVSKSNLNSQIYVLTDQLQEVTNENKLLKEAVVNLIIESTKKNK